ncbi:FxsA family protein [Paenibacillus gansuensis]|uniref:FxsA family protein n=1 Tax=Paenibacillus gansuensis TaxID=306542 RepID=A0ABW5PES3_9BACL
MLKWLVILFIVVPALEVWSLIQMGQWIGGWQTFGLILLTGFLGAYLAKKEARKVFAAARAQMEAGRVPSTTILDGICVLAGGLMLLSPGFLTDIVGFLILFPPTRPFFRLTLQGFIQNRLMKGNGTFTFFKIK